MKRSLVWPLVIFFALALAKAQRVDRSGTDTRSKPDEPPFKRTFFLLKGHSVDLLARKAKFPPELERELGGNLTFLETDVFRQLRKVKDAFSESLETEEIEEDAESGTRLDPAELQRLKRDKVIAPAAGNGQDVTNFDATGLPGTFYSQPWHISGAAVELFQAKGGPHGERVSELRDKELTIRAEALGLRKNVTRTDIEPLKRAGNDDKLFAFFDDATRNGVPSDFLQLRLESGCGGGSSLTMPTPTLQVRVLVLENTSTKALQIGDFQVRDSTPARNLPAIRTAAANTSDLARIGPKSVPLYPQRILKPREKLVIPVAMVLTYRGSFYARNDETEGETKAADEARAEFGRARAALTRNAAIERITLTVERPSEGSEKPQYVPLVTYSKAQFIQALERQPPTLNVSTDFIYGPYMEVDAVRIGSLSYPIRKQDPRYVSFHSGFEGGSCPFVYVGTDTGGWLKQGTILTHRGAKHREGTDQMLLHSLTGVVKISEEEAEVSYIDHLYVRVEAQTGEMFDVCATDGRLAAADGVYMTLGRGQATEVRFTIPRHLSPRRMTLYASGYYLPLPRKPSSQ